MRRGIALDDDRAAPHPIAGAVAGVAADHDGAAPHPGGLARQRAAEPFRRRPGNLDLPSTHARAGPGAGVALDREPAAAHASAGLNADVALDHDLALAHVPPDAVEPVARTLDADVVDRAQAQPK